METIAKGEGIEVRVRYHGKVYTESTRFTKELLSLFNGKALADIYVREASMRAMMAMRRALKANGVK